jgi:hypothetical protein
MVVMGFEIALPVLHRLSMLRHHRLQLDGDLYRRWRRIDNLGGGRRRGLSRWRLTEDKVNPPICGAGEKREIQGVDKATCRALLSDRGTLFQQIRYYALAEGV